MSSLVAGAPVDGVLAPLKTARVRHRVRAIGLAALWSLSAALLARLVSDSGVAVYAVGAVAGAIGLLLARQTTPSIAELARRADHRFGLGERLSTALQPQPAAGGWAAVLAESQRRDAAALAAKIDPRPLSPLLTGSVALAVLVLAAVIGGSVLTPTPVLPVPTPVVSAEALDTAARAENLRSIAGTIAADANARDNPYLSAVADAVAKLAEMPDLSAQRLNAELTSLLDHARLAYGRSLPAWMRGDAASPDDPFHLNRDSSLAALADGAREQKDDGTGGAGDELVPELLSERGLLPNIPAPPPGQIQLAPDAGDLNLSTVNAGGDSNTATSGPGKVASAPPGGAAPALGDSEGKPVDAAGAGMPVGAASQSGAGASRVAGDGTQALEDPTRAAAAPIAVRDDDVLLPADKYRQGKRIRVEVTPQSPGGVTDGAGATTTAADGAQTPVLRGVPSVRDQQVFARYFTHGEAP